MPDEMKNRLQVFIRKQEGYQKATVENLSKMSGGASKETWAFDLAMSGHELLPLVLRVNRRSPLTASIGLKDEFALMTEVHGAGIQVPRPYWYGKDDSGRSFYVIQRIEGETIVTRLHKDVQYEKARDVMPAQLGKILARIHRIPSARTRFHFLPCRQESGSSALGQILFYEDLFRRYSPDPHPALELAIRWLKRNDPQPGHLSLVHGDYRLGNVIFTEKGVRSVLDWELAHIGDPMEDVGYISVQAWRFGIDAKPIGGIGERADFYNAYEKAGGFSLDASSVQYWEIFGNLLWAIITILQMSPFLNGYSNSIELASLGRKTAEVELQLLTLIEEL